MLEIVETLEEKHYTDTRAMTQVLVRCLRCQSVHRMLEQNAVRHNRRGSKHCEHCATDRFHYLTGTRIWRIWCGMKYRCGGISTSARGQRNYSERGITYCVRWEKFENFYEDMREGYSDDLTIERINVNGHYCKENCRWATNMEQQSNKRNNRVIPYQGDQIHLAEFCRRTGMSRGKVTTYLNRGLTGDEAAAAAQASTYNMGRPRKPRSTTSSTADPATNS